MSVSNRKRVEAEDLYRLQLIEGCEISPDGRHVAYAVRRVDKQSEKKYANLWIVQAKGGRAQQFTHGDHVDGSPRWSPDGSQIAFMSNRVDDKEPQIFVIPFGGGEGRQLTHMKGNFKSFSWSPNGKQILCEFRKRDTAILEREKDPKKKELGEVSRHIKRVFYKMDGEGFFPEERWHLWTISAATGSAKQLTQDPVTDEYDASWSPDGKRIVFCSNRTKDPDLEPESTDLYVINAAGGRMRKIDAPLGGKRLPVYSPNGRSVAYFATLGKGRWWQNTCVFSVPASGKARALNLTKHTDLEFSNVTVNDLGFPGLSPPTWSADGQRIYAQVSRKGNTELHAVRAEGKGHQESEALVASDGVVVAFSFSRDRRWLAYHWTSMDDPGQIVVRNVDTGSSKTVTRSNRPLLRSRDLGTVEEVWFKGRTGNKLQGWIVKPPGFRSSRKYPSIMEIHGGPLMQYGNMFMHEFYFLAANGYVVYFCNPRGGQGYGETHSKAIDNDWGSADYDDVMAWAAYMSRKPYINASRMGVTGGSYGGYMTNWIIGHTTKFKAAVTQRSVSNLISMYGSSDGNWIFQRIFGDKPPWEDMENYWRQSPMKHIGKARTPTLVIHSEEDLRCDMEQGEQIFVALKKLGVDTEMVRFPEEPHGLSRGGRTDRRIDRLNHILRWFDRYLK